MEKSLKDDEFVQYIVKEYFPSSDMTYHEKIQTVFSSIEEFNQASERFKSNAEKVKQ